MSKQQVLCVKNLSFIYEGAYLLRDISLSMNKGEIATLIGASGSGKTTLFKLITGILPPKDGYISIANTFLPEVHRHVAYMMQDDLLLPWRTVQQNLMLMTELGQHRCQTSLAEVQRMLSEIDMANYGHYFPHQLSGGMRQRVSLARALMHQRPLLLLDEPFNSLDVSLREQMYALLRQIRTTYETTMLLVTHDFRDALSLSDRIFLLSDGVISKEWQITDAIRLNPVMSAKVLEEMRAGISKKNSKA